MILATFIAKVFDPLLFLVSALVVWIGFRQDKKAIVLYAALAATLVNLIVMYAVSISPPRPLALIMSFPAALLQSYLVFLLRARGWRREQAKGSSDETAQD